MANQGAQGGARIDPVSRRIVEHIEQVGGLPQKVRTPEAAAAVLCVLSRRLSKGQAQDFARSLPEALQTLVHPCAAHRGLASDVFDRGEFLRLLAEHLKIEPGEAERVARAVLQGVHALLPQVEIEHLRSQLPSELWELWGPRRVAA
ncbi:DUF2267 domain-containing protein [Polyangium sorediatum]|uniref:DUF2267 domain-containing protein n=1 Tax=Polyangium sorediatum TaxID=889274 RepID=A0ABT6NT32_9BACT|nr:DUF2267 domain-containing protein [Polyangium sorediatum]MDI1431469.1 DUF2267 domain-containing protein [Polyangium sorediatum]